MIPACAGFYLLFTGLSGISSVKLSYLWKPKVLWELLFSAVLHQERFYIGWDFWPNQEDGYWLGFGCPEIARLRLSFCCSGYLMKQTGTAWTGFSEFRPQNVLSLFWSVYCVAWGRNPIPVLGNLFFILMWSGNRFNLSILHYWKTVLLIQLCFTLVHLWLWIWKVSCQWQKGI